MCKELKDELDKGNKLAQQLVHHAQQLVHHMVVGMGMGALKVEIPVEQYTRTTIGRVVHKYKVTVQFEGEFVRAEDPKDETGPEAVR